MQSQRWAWTHRHAVPLFVASLVAVVLAGGGLIGVLVYDRGGDQRNNETDPGPDPSSSFGSGSGPGTSTAPVGDPSMIDPCVVGEWRVVSQSEDLLGVGTLKLVGDGPLFEYRADGNGRADYGEATLLQTTGIATVDATVDGELAFRYRAHDGEFQLLEVDSTATITLDFWGRMEYRLETEPISYQCDDDVLQFSEPSRGYHAELHRQ